MIRYFGSNLLSPSEGEREGSRPKEKEVCRTADEGSRRLVVLRRIVSRCVHGSPLINRIKKKNIKEGNKRKYKKKEEE